MPSPLFSATIAGSLPKPAWLSETQKLWPQWKAEGAELAQAKADATLLWIKAQEDAGLDVIGDGEQSRVDRGLDLRGRQQGFAHHPEWRPARRPSRLDASAAGFAPAR